DRQALPAALHVVEHIKLLNEADHTNETGTLASTEGVWPDDRESRRSGPTRRSKQAGRKGRQGEGRRPKGPENTPTCGRSRGSRRQGRGHESRAPPRRATRGRPTRRPRPESRGKREEALWQPVLPGRCGRRETIKGQVGRRGGAPEGPRTFPKVAAR